MDYKLLKEAFYNTYKSYMDYLRLTKQENDMFYILVIRTPLKNDLTNIDIIINGLNASTSKQNYIFKNSAVLNNIEAKNLIDDIREDFKINHYISFCTVSTSDSIQRIQNTNYSLNIKLLNKAEQEEAMLYNSYINTDKQRHKALLK